MKIKTDLLKDVLNRVYKGAGECKFIPITSLLNIKCENRTLVFSTTDSNLYYSVALKTNASSDEYMNFNVCVRADRFCKLIKYMESDFVDIKLKERYLSVSGTGRYKIDLVLDEDGNYVKFNSLREFNVTESGSINKEDIKSIIENNRSCLSNMSEGVLSYYYCGESVLTTDRYVMCRNNIKLFDRPILLPDNVITILSLMDGNIKYKKNMNEVLFYTDTDTLHYTVCEYPEDFPKIDKVLNVEQKYSCKLNKEDLIPTLNILKLFSTEKYDKNAVNLTFEGNGLKIQSKNLNAENTVPIFNNDGNFHCLINGDFLKNQLSSVSENEILVKYGNDVMIMFEYGKVLKVVALVMDEK